jgi:ferrous iron transport protein A
MDASASPAGLSLDPRHVNLSTLSPGAVAKVVKVGSSTAVMSALERRLLELGFIHGEHIEVLAEARPGRDPFVVRVGHTTLALRRGEAHPVWVEMLTNP